MRTNPTMPITMLNTVQFVVGQDGRPTAVQMGIEVWNLLLDWLEDHEDRAAIKAFITALRNDPKQAGALRWEEVREQWNS